jgi:hypothetical protein
MNSAGRHRKSSAFVKYAEYALETVTKNFGSKLIFMLVAIGLWLSINLEKDFETIIEIPVFVNNVQKGKTIAKTVPDKAQVKIRSKGKNLLLQRTGKDVFISIDASNVTDSMTFRITGDYFVNMSGSDLEPLFIYFPQEVEIILDNYAVKKIPVKLNSQYSMAAGYVRSGPFSIDPDSIVISGPASLVRPVNYAETEKIIDSGITSDYSKTLNIIKKNSSLITYSVLSVKVYQMIVRKGSNSFKIPVRVLNIPEGINLLIDPIAIDVKVTGPVNELHAIGAGDFSATADFLTYDPQTNKMKLDVSSQITQEWAHDTYDIRAVQY